ncbi:MAG: sigma-70 family RNA polymerase sigma factor [Phycisphaerae bacterium]|nr:sigma-70 family RNA polymerase sigma factor [Gemmatimonadaceae bacterium]
MRTEAHYSNHLVASMASGDERAAARLYDEFSPVLFALALRIVGERADAEEVVLDAFTQAWKNAAYYSADRSSVLSWLSMITRTRALDFLRARSRRAKAMTVASQAMGDEPIGTADAVRNAGDKLEDEERAAAVGLALHSLTCPQRTAIELSFFAGLTHLEIAERLGEPLGTVKTRIRLGMQHMRNMLGDVSTLGITSTNSMRPHFAG